MSTVELPAAAWVFGRTGHSSPKAPPSAECTAASGRQVRSTLNGSRRSRTANARSGATRW